MRKHDSWSTSVNAASFLRSTLANVFLFAALFLLPLDGSAQISSSELTLKARQTRLEDLHRSVYGLSLPQEQIHHEVMAGIRADRLTVAPHFPERGQSEEATKQNIRFWLSTYPDELDAYAAFVGQRINKYSSSSSK